MRTSSKADTEIPKFGCQAVTLVRDSTNALKCVEVMVERYFDVNQDADAKPRNRDAPATTTYRIAKSREAPLRSRCNEARGNTTGG